MIKYNLLKRKSYWGMHLIYLVAFFIFSYGIVFSKAAYFIFDYSFILFGLGVPLGVVVGLWLAHILRVVNYYD